MWGFWFITSAIFFGLAAYFLKKRGAYKYPPKEAVYTNKVEVASPVHQEVPPIDAEYTVSPAPSTSVQSTPSTHIPPVSPPTTPSFFGEMSNAVKEEKEDNEEKAADDTPIRPQEEETETEPKFRNIRFFDS